MHCADSNATQEQMCSCDNAYVCPHICEPVCFHGVQGTGWDITALSDVHPEYAGSCGRCYEVKCRNDGFKDGYGNWIDRKGETHSTKSVELTRGNCTAAGCCRLVAAIDSLIAGPVQHAAVQVVR